MKRRRGRATSNKKRGSAGARSVAIRKGSAQHMRLKAINKSIERNGSVTLRRK